MPIVPNWTNLIIIFEMTMLSAIIATVITLLVTAGIPSRGGKMYDPEVSDGYILVGVENPADALEARARARDRRRPRENTSLQIQSPSSRAVHGLQFVELHVRYRAPAVICTSNCT